METFATVGPRTPSFRKLYDRQCPLIPTARVEDSQVGDKIEHRTFRSKEPVSGGGWEEDGGGPIE